VLKLLPYPTASHPSGQVLFQGADLLAMNERQLRQVRGNKITMIFQEPMTSLNPLHTIEQQIVEILKLHQGMADRPAKARTLALLLCGICAPAALSRKMKSPAFCRAGNIARMASTGKPPVVEWELLKVVSCECFCRWGLLVSASFRS